MGPPSNEELPNEERRSVSFQSLEPDTEVSNLDGKDQPNRVFKFCRPDSAGRDTSPFQFSKKPEVSLNMARTIGHKKAEDTASPVLISKTAESGSHPLSQSLEAANYGFSLDVFQSAAEEFPTSVEPKESYNLDGQDSDILPIFMPPEASVTPSTDSRRLKSNAVSVTEVCRQNESPEYPLVAPHDLAANPSGPKTPVKHPAIRTNASEVLASRGKPLNPIRVTKSRKDLKRRRDPNGSEKQPLITPQPVPTTQQLFHLMMYQIQQDKEAGEGQLERLLADIQARDTDLEAREADLEESEQAYVELASQVQVLRQNLQTQEAELSKYQKTVPGWKAKLRKLEDFVKGLTNDHHKLRDDATIMANTHKDLNAERITMEASIRDAKDYLTQAMSSNNNASLKAQHQIETLEQMILQHEDQKRQDASLLTVERNRSARLENELSTMSNNHQQLLETLEGQRQAVMGRLDELLKEAPASGARQSNNDEQKDMLNECLGLLKELQSASTVKPENLQQLDLTINAYAKCVTATFEQLSQDNQASKKKKDSFEHDMQSQLNTLATGLKTEQALFVDMAKIQEAKTVTEEKLRASEAALHEAKTTVLCFQSQEELQAKEISGMKAELTQLKREEAEKNLYHGQLREAEITNAQLEAEVTKLKQDLAGLLQRPNSDSARLQESIAQLQKEVDRCHEAASSWEESKSKSEALAQDRYDRMKSQFLQTSDAERKILNQSHVTALQEVETQKAEIESRNKQAQGQLKELRTSYEAMVKNVSQLRSEISTLHTKSNADKGRIAELLGTVHSAEEDILSKNAELQNVRDVSEAQTREKTDMEAQHQLSDLQVSVREDHQVNRLNHACREFDKAATEQSGLNDAVTQIISLLTQAGIVKSGSTQERPPLKFASPVVTQAISPRDVEMNSSQTICSQPTSIDPRELAKGGESPELPYSGRHKMVKENEPQELPYHGRNSQQTGPILNGSETILNASGQAGEEKPKTPAAKPRRKVNRSATGTSLVASRKETRLVAQDSQLEEPTIQRSVQRTISVQEVDSVLIAEANLASDQRRSTESIRPFSQINDDSDLDSEWSSNGDTTGLFPPTPVFGPREPSRDGFPVDNTSLRPSSRTITTTFARTSSDLITFGSESYEPARNMGSPRLRPAVSEQSKQGQGSLSVRPPVPTGTGNIVNHGRAITRTTAMPTPAARPSVPNAHAPPCGILAESSGMKRNASNAGLGGPVGRTVSRKIVGLGPIIGESQSPSAFPVKTRTSQARKSQRRINQEAKFKKCFDENRG